jgi:hypothetical protein
MGGRMKKLPLAGWGWYKAGKNLSGLSIYQPNPGGPCRMYLNGSSSPLNQSLFNFF